MPHHTLDLIPRLQSVIDEQLRDLVEPGRPFALIDFPNHNNVGDSAIWMGELAFFDRLGMRASYVCEHSTLDEKSLEAIIGDGPIYLHGGGNFGDLWPGFTEFRLRVLSSFPARRIIQLPQTIQFRSLQQADALARAIERQGNFTLLVRDHRSRDFAEHHFACEVRLCPDMAFAIGSVEPPKPRHDLLLNLREDHEASARHDIVRAISRQGTIVSDWPDEPPDFRRTTKRAAIVRALLTGDIGGRARMTELAFRERARRRFDRGIALLGSARHVITDRMHGHIMCTLLDQPHAVLDNSYGKTSGFISAWETCASGRAHLVHSVDEALDCFAKAEA